MARVSDRRPRGVEVPIEWNGAKLTAYLPTPLAAQDFAIGARAIRATERAARTIEFTATRLLRFEPLAMLLLRSEGVASSNFEGINAPLADLAAAEVGGTQNPAAVAIADNLAAVSDALSSASDPLSEGLIRAWHHRLMRDDRHLDPSMVGAYRTTQSWIGGTSPRDAAFIPPPQEHIGKLMADLVSFANAEDVDPVTQAAIIHAQFESIHPFGDGNGRIGRILIGWLLAHRLDVAVPPPLSVFVALDPGGYLAGLTLFRTGQLDPWVEWMSTALWRSCEIATLTIERTEATIERWRSTLSAVRQDATAVRVLDLLPKYPVISADLISASIGVSPRSGRRALEELAAHGVVERYVSDTTRPGRPTQFWMATELLTTVERSR